MALVITVTLENTGIVIEDSENKEIIAVIKVNKAQTASKARVCIDAKNKYKIRRLDLNNLLTEGDKNAKQQ